MSEWVTCWCWADGVIGVRGGVGGTNAFCCCFCWAAVVDCVCDRLAPFFSSAGRKFSLVWLNNWLANRLKSKFCTNCWCNCDWHALKLTLCKSLDTFAFAVSSSTAVPAAASPLPPPLLSSPFDWFTIWLNWCIWFSCDSQNCVNWFNWGWTSIFKTMDNFSVAQKSQFFDQFNTHLHLNSNRSHQQTKTYRNRKQKINDFFCSIKCSAFFAWKIEIRKTKKPTHKLRNFLV